MSGVPKASKSRPPHALHPEPCPSGGQEAGPELGRYFIGSSDTRALSRVTAWRRWRQGGESQSPDAGGHLIPGSSHKSPSCWVSGLRGPRSLGAGTDRQGGQPLEAKVQQHRKKPTGPPPETGGGPGGREGGLARNSLSPCLAAGSPAAGGVRLRPRRRASGFSSATKRTHLRASSPGWRCLSGPQ